MPAACKPPMPMGSNAGNAALGQRRWTGSAPRRARPRCHRTGGHWLGEAEQGRQAGYSSPPHAAAPRPPRSDAISLVVPPPLGPDRGYGRNHAVITGQAKTGGPPRLPAWGTTRRVLAPASVARARRPGSPSSRQRHEPPESPDAWPLHALRRSGQR
jgi:hypothetical protein